MEEFDVVKNLRAKSSVWQHFGLNKLKKDSSIAENVAVCRSCNCVVKCSGGTTNLMAHIRRNHPSIITESSATPTGSTKTLTMMPAAPKQPTLSQMINSSVKYNPKSAKSTEITNKISRFIIKDLRPYSMVDSVEFREMIKSLDPKYQVPSRKTFSEVNIPQMYNEVKVDVKKDLARAEQVALTSDGWTSRATESYVTITSTHINDDWELVNYVLQTRPLSESHTAENIATVLKDAIAEWGVPNSPPIVSDNAANMLKAMTLMDGSVHIPCFAHTINLAAQKTLKIKKISNVLAKIRRIVAFFHRSSTAAALLKCKASLLELPQVKLLIDVCTRWNSAYDMVSRYLELQVAVLAVLRGNELPASREKDLDTLSNDDLLIAQEIQKCLKPLKDITTMLCSESSPTLSVIMPLRHKLLSTVFSPTDNDSVCIAEMKTVMFNDFQERYIKQEQVMNVASVLDARFKQLPYLSQTEKAKVHASLFDEVSKCNFTPVQKIKTEPGTIGPLPLPDNESENPPLPCLPTLLPSLPTLLPTVDKHSNETGNVEVKCVLQDVLGDVYITQIEQPHSKNEQIQAEVKLYLDAPSVPLNVSPLSWWKCNEIAFPHVARLAKRLLQIPATSVPSERVFSTAGDIVTQQRALLKAKHVDMLIFLKKNMK